MASMTARPPVCTHTHSTARMKLGTYGGNSLASTAAARLAFSAELGEHGGASLVAAATVACALPLAVRLAPFAAACPSLPPSATVAAFAASASSTGMGR